MKLVANVGEKFYGWFDCSRFSVDIKQTTTWDNNAAIEIHFAYRDGSLYHGGFVEISPELAQWLGSALISAAEGQMKEKGLSVDVHSNKEITAQKNIPTAKNIIATITTSK